MKSDKLHDFFKYSKNGLDKINRNAKNLLICQIILPYSILNLFILYCSPCLVILSDSAALEIL